MRLDAGMQWTQLMSLLGAPMRPVGFGEWGAMLAWLYEEVVADLVASVSQCQVHLVTCPFKRSHQRRRNEMAARSWSPSTSVSSFCRRTQKWPHNIMWWHDFMLSLMMFIMPLVWCHQANAKKSCLSASGEYMSRVLDWIYIQGTHFYILSHNVAQIYELGVYHSSWNLYLIQCFRLRQNQLQTKPETYHNLSVGSPAHGKKLVPERILGLKGKHRKHKKECRKHHDDLLPVEEEKVHKLCTSILHLKGSI